MEHSLTMLVLVSSQFSIWAAAGSLPVLVHDYAGVAPNVLARAEVEASRVLATAGVDVQWTNCIGLEHRSRTMPAITGCNCTRRADPARRGVDARCGA